MMLLRGCYGPSTGLPRSTSAGQLRCRSQKHHGRHLPLNAARSALLSLDEDSYRLRNHTVASDESRRINAGTMLTAELGELQ